MSEARLLGLPAIEPAEAELRRGVIETLTGRRVGNALLVACVGRRRDDRGDWLVCANGVSIAFDRVDGSPTRLLETDGFNTIRLLEQVEPILRDIEVALGIELDPLEVVTHSPMDAVIVTISADEHCQPVHSLRLVIPPTLALLSNPAPFAPELLGRVAIATTVVIDGPRIAPHDAAELTAGDCILLGNQPLAASLSVGGLAAIPGIFDPASQSFQCR